MNSVLEVILKAKDEISAVAAKAKKSLDDVGHAAADIGKKAALGAGVAGVAIAGFAAISLKDFTAFERKMNEVFTLMPGISEESMGQMTDQVKKFSKDFGVLPEQVVPALYQSLSAGVPADNVFAFMEVAQKAAKGGVTELTTAVNGISSVVNAYGSDIIDAGKASDLMFTAVRLGKTSFGEMSASLSQVVPTAVSLGVGFDQVTAAVTQLTLKGVPTAQATTQIRAAMLEASKGGSKLDTALKEMLGGSFQQLIAKGYSVGEVFHELKQETEKSGKSFNDLFGSAEAMSAALIMSSDAGAEYAGILDSMQQSAGATDGAFQQMEKGIGPKIDKLKAQFAVLKLEVGERLAPVLIALLSWLLATGVPAMQNFAAAIAPLAMDAAAFAKVVVEQVTPFLLAFIAILRDDILPVAQMLVNFFRENESASQALGVAIGAVLVAAFVALAISAGAAAVSMLIAAAPIIAIIAVIALLSAGIFLLIKHWDTITDKVPALGVAFDVVKRAIEVALQFAERLLAGFLLYVEGQIDILIGIFKILKGFFTGDWALAWEGLKQIGEGALKMLRGVVDIGLAGIRTLFSNFGSDVKKLATDALTGFVNVIADLPGKVVALGPDMLQAGSQFAKSLMSGIASGLSAIGGFAGDVASAVGGAIKSAINTQIIDRLNGIQIKFSIKGAPDITIPFPNIPRLAMGGIVTGPTLAMLGDNASGREAIIPLERASEMGFSGRRFRDLIIMPPPGFGSDDAAYARKLLEEIRRAGGDI